MKEALGQLLPRGRGGGRTGGRASFSSDIFYSKLRLANITLLGKTSKRADADNKKGPQNDCKSVVLNYFAFNVM